MIPYGNIYISELQDYDVREGLFTHKHQEKNKTVVLNEFKINEFLKIKLIKVGNLYRITIFIKNEEFIQCKYLLLNVPIEKIEDLEEINSIDEATEKLDHSLEFKKTNTTFHLKQNFLVIVQTYMRGQIIITILGFSILI